MTLSKLESQKNDKYISSKLIKVSSGHILVFGQINGINGTFILDTGAGATVIDKKNKDKFKMIASESEEKASGVGGSNIQTLISEKNHFKIGEKEITKQKLILMNLDHVNDAFEKKHMQKVDGVIGSDILTNNKAIIDYSTLKIYLKL